MTEAISFAKRIWPLALAVVATVLAGVALWKMRLPVLALMVAIPLAGAAHPIVLGLRKLGLPRTLAIAVVWGLGLLLTVALFSVLATALLSDLRRATDALSVAYERLTSNAGPRPWLEGVLADVLPEPRRLYGTLAGLRPGFLGGALDVGGAALHLVSGLVLIVALSVLWSASRPDVERLVISFIPASGRVSTRALLWKLEMGVGRCLRAELLRATLTVATLTLVFQAMRLPYPTLPAMAAALLGVVPLAGPLLGVAAAGLTGLTVGPTMALAAVGSTSAALAIIHLVVIPGLGLGRSAHPILVALALLPLTGAFGVLGFLAAPAVAAALQIAGDHLLVRETPGPVIATSWQEARGRLAALEARLKKSPLPPPTELASLLERLSAVANHEDPRPRPGSGAQARRAPVPT